MANYANSPSWVRTYINDDGTEYQIAYRTKTTWSVGAGGAPSSGSFVTNLQVDRVAIDAGITGGGTNATWTTGATRGIGASGAWERKYLDTTQTNLGFVLPDKGWSDLNNRKSNFGAQVNNNAAVSIAKYFITLGFGKGGGLGSQAGAMREISKSQGSGNQGNPTDAGEAGNRFAIKSLPEEDSARKKQRDKYQSSFTYFYPVALKRNYTQDKLSISVLKYKAREITNTYKIQSREKSHGGAARKILGTCILPAPGGIGDQHSCSWGPDNMDPASLAIANATFEALSKPGGVNEKASEMIDRVKKAGADIKSDPDISKALAAMFTKQATGMSGNILTRKTGNIQNPNMELLFNAPTLRPFAFTYRMSPRNREESIMVKRIIRMFKQSMMPSQSPSGLFLESPNTYKLKFLNGNRGEHDFLPKIKECALTSFNVNYTPDGNYATYEDSSMVAYEVQFGFQELEPIFNQDYGALDGNTDQSIGY